MTMSDLHPKTDPSDFLKQARSVINRGWCRGSFTKTIADRTHHCAIGAMNEVHNFDSNTVLEAQLALVKEIRASGYDNHSDGSYESTTVIMAWNDNHAKDKRAVIRVFDQAIKELSK